MPCGIGDQAETRAQPFFFFKTKVIIWKRSALSAEKNFRVKVTALGIVLMNAEILLCTQMR